MPCSCTRAHHCASTAAGTHVQLMPAGKVAMSPFWISTGSPPAVHMAGCKDVYCSAPVRMRLYGMGPRGGAGAEAWSGAGHRW